jgi:hypothetical protein
MSVPLPSDHYVKLNAEYRHIANTEGYESARLWLDEFSAEEREAILAAAPQKRSNLSLVSKQDDETKAIKERKPIKRQGLAALPAKVHVVRRLQIAANTLALLCATGSSGKTMLAQYIACCVSSGTNILRDFPVKKGKVIHLDAEQSEDQTQRRYERLMAGLKLDEIDVERITLGARLDSSKLDHAAVERELIEAFTGATLAIVDSLKAVSEADENSADIERVLKMFKRVAEKTTCAVLLIHHKGKQRSDAKQSGRGHSSIYDSVDVQIDLDAEQGVYELWNTKNRDGRIFDGIKYQVIDGGGYNAAQDCSETLEFQALQTDVKPKGNELRDSILFALEKHVSLNHSDLYKEVGGARNKYGEALASLLSSAVVQCTEKGKEKIYTLIQKEDQSK